MEAALHLPSSTPRRRQEQLNEPLHEGPRLPGPCRVSRVGTRLCSILQMCRSPPVCQSFPMGSWELRLGGSCDTRGCPTVPWFGSVCPHRPGAASQEKAHQAMSFQHHTPTPAGANPLRMSQTGVGSIQVLQTAWHSCTDSSVPKSSPQGGRDGHLPGDKVIFQVNSWANTQEERRTMRTSAPFLRGHLREAQGGKAFPKYLQCSAHAGEVVLAREVRLQIQ